MDGKTSGKVAVIGLGYVGLPLACLCARKSYFVLGVDIIPEIVEKTNKGISHIKDPELEKGLKKASGKITATDKFEGITGCDTVVICVPTPVDEKYKPDLRPLKSACNRIYALIQKGQLIIVESTIYPGVIEEVVKPILERSGLKAGEDFYLAHCPERIDPGNAKWNVENIPRVVGSISDAGLKKAAEFYRSILDAQVYELSSVKAAEAVKIMENTFRDVNIAFVNELAKSFDKFGIDISEVIRGASSKPFGFMAFHPGCGVGGHCIPVDPYYLIERARGAGFDHKFLKLARDINHSMPEYTVDLLESKLGDLKGEKVGVMGMAYKRDVDDLRESPALKIIALLKERGADLSVYDPFIPKKSDATSLDEFLDKVDYVILATDHTEFREMDAGKLREKGIEVVIDGRNCLDREKITALGILYKGIGR
ncbi:MAG: nucleotide sugar dehydrogenase [Candidatus Altiarchaeota archaeon]|nr:nucleotide sugar dehydrogenase [Candidatus Altiarchaeota archaeon]